MNNLVADVIDPLLLIFDGLLSLICLKPVFYFGNIFYASVVVSYFCASHF